VAGHHQYAAEFVKQHQQLGATHVLVVHDLLQMVSASEIVQQPAGKESKGGTWAKSESTQQELILPPSRFPLPWDINQKVHGLRPSFT